jgi:hypothetical protein
VFFIICSGLLLRVENGALGDQVDQVGQAIALFPESYRQVINIGIITKR